MSDVKALAQRAKEAARMLKQVSGRSRAYKRICQRRRADRGYKRASEHGRQPHCAGGGYGCRAVRGYKGSAHMRKRKRIYPQAGGAACIRKRYRRILWKDMI